MLGFVFKVAKDVEDATEMTFIGYDIRIAGGEVSVRAKEATRHKLRAKLAAFKEAETTPFTEVEEFMGVWGHAARVCMLWRIWQNPVYASLAPQYEAIAQGVPREEVRVTWTPEVRSWLQRLEDDLDWREPNKPFRWAHWLQAR
jgi:hypothetical protein